MPISGFVIAVQIRQKPGACNTGEYEAKGQLKLNREPKTNSENPLLTSKFLSKSKPQKKESTYRTNRDEPASLSEGGYFEGFPWEAH